MIKITALIIATILTCCSYSYDFPVKDFSNPQKTMNYFLKSMKGYKLGHTEGAERASKAFDLRNYSESTKTIKGEEYSIKLINIFDRMEYIKIDDIPTKPDYDIWHYKKDILKIDDKTRSVEISMVKEKDQWKFSKETIRSLDYYEIFLKDKKIVKGVIADTSLRTRIKSHLPKWVFKENFFLKNIQWLGLIALILFSFIIDRIVRFVIASRILSFFKKKHLSIQEFEEQKFLAPLGKVVFLIVFKSLVFILELSPQTLAVVAKVTDIFLTLAVIFTLNQGIEVLCLFLLDKAKETENKFDDILVPLISKTARFFVYAFGIVYIGDALDLNMKNILAGMGIGGIAFALAAKDTVSNLFGSFTVLLDRPFSIGDWIVINGNIEGTVEDVGLRSTRIRTFYDSVITVPNGNLTSAYVDNNGKRRYRRFSTKLNFEYSTPVEKIENFCEAVRVLLTTKPGVRQDYFHVYFNSMSSSSLDVLLYVFFDVPDWNEELKERHNLLLDIMRIAQKLEINFAFPTQTLHLFNEQGVEHTESEASFTKMKELISNMDEKRNLMQNNRSGADRMSYNS